MPALFYSSSMTSSPVGLHLELFSEFVRSFLSRTNRVNKTNPPEKAKIEFAVQSVHPCMEIINGNGRRLEETS